MKLKIISFFTIMSLTLSYSQTNEIIFKVDERTEFFRTIFNLAVEDVIASEWKTCETVYYKSVKAHFDPYKSHPLIDYILENDNIRIDFSAVGLMYKDFEHFEFDTAYIADLNEMGLTITDVETMKPMLIDFYNKTRFKEFFAKNGAYYHSATEKLQFQAQKERIFERLEDFYQAKKTGLRFLVFVELTNNVNNKALTFYDHHNADTRAMILTNLCQEIPNPTEANHILELDNVKKGILFHEISHLYTDKLLNKYIGQLSDYKSICKECSDSKIRDFVDHYIVNVLQSVLMKRLNNDSSREDAYLNHNNEVKMQIYLKLLAYDPQGQEKFEDIYSECIELIRSSAKF